jgi:hypothetical protein
MRFPLSAAFTAATLALGSPLLAAEPWSDADPSEEAPRHVEGDYGYRVGAEYRAQWLTVDPIGLASERGRRVSWLEHRLRVEGVLDFKDTVRLHLSTDVLDGALWGDNGSLGTEPSPNAGVNVATKNPNEARPCVGSRGGDLLDFEAYGYTLCSAEPFHVRHLYGEAALPFGLLRVGRQPVNIGTGVQSADGEGRANRFGVAHGGSYVDRILFATKPLEALKPASKRSRSANEGLVAGVAYDRWVNDDVHLFGDDVHQMDATLRLSAPTWALGENGLAALYYAHRWDADNATRINTVGARAMSRFGPVYAGFEVATNLGSSREIGEAYRLITNDPPAVQDVKQLGARATVRWDAIPRKDYDRSVLSLFLEGAYASGDEDPNIRTPLTQFVFAEDANVGLLLFEHVLAYQSARAAAAGVEVLRRLGATSFPAEAINTRGSFTNAIAIFPQVDFRPLPELLFRGGVLVAWGAERVVNPVASLQARDGLTIEDDLVNFVGGKPARFYGTEIDGRIQYRFMEHFLVDLEGALLFPGEALQDQDGNAVRSGLVQGRGTFVF